MNQYGTMAREHWARWLPGRYSQIEDPDSFFTALGEEVAQQIGDLMLDLAGDGPPGEDYLAKVGRLNMARLQAEEMVLAERVLLPPEPAAARAGEKTGAGEEPEIREHPEASDPETGRQSRPAIVGRSHPLWEQVNTEQQERIQGS